MAVEQRIARVNSGDVSLFYRVFGSPGKTPVVILHGSNYYDSYDWINVATQLADRPRGGDPGPARLGRIDLEPEQGLLARCPARTTCGP